MTVRRPTAKPPGPRGSLVLGSARAFLRDQLGFLTRTARAYGDIAHFRLGPERVFLVNHPDLIHAVLITHQRRFKKGRGLERARRLLGDGLLTSEGAFHLRQRRLAQPAFHRCRIAGYADVMVRRTRDMISGWHHGETRDVARELSALTMGIAGETLFGADVLDEAPEIGRAVKDFLDLFWRATLPFSGLLDWLPVRGTRRFVRARDRVDATIRRIVAARRRTSEDRGDLLSMLLVARDAAGDGTGMTDAQLRDEILTIFLAGHETTANALGWTLMLLTRHPAVLRRMEGEIDAALGDRPATADDLAALPFTRQVVSEAMRLYPPGWLLARRAVEPVPLGDYEVPRRALVFLSQWVTHRDARFYPEPERFEPDRWTPAALASRPRYAYFPFGGGSRQCLGEHFALLEIVMVLSTIVRTWRFELVPGHPIVPQPTVTLRPRHGLAMTLAARTGPGRRKRSEAGAGDLAQPGDGVQQLRVRQVRSRTEA